MTELLQFMYQGEVNVKHTELQAFMKIAEMLQIKGLTTPTNQKLASPPMRRQTSPQTSPASLDAAKQSASGSEKRPAPSDAAAGSYDVYAAKKTLKRSISTLNDSSGGETHGDMTNDSMDNMTDEVFMPQIPQISMGGSESQSTPQPQRFDLTSVKRENPDLPTSPHQRPLYVAAGTGGYDFNGGSGSSSVFPPMKPMDVGAGGGNAMNDQGHQDFNNSKGSHMEIPAGK